jgi:uncharacterized protein (DUF1501 family)
MREDSEFADAMRRLSIEDMTDEGISRRELLKMALLGAGGVGISAVGGPWGRAAAASSQPSRQAGAPPGLLLMIQLGGGNDGFNTLVPMAGTAGSIYRNIRGELAIADAVAINKPGTATPTGMGLHPSLPFVTSEFNAGRVAFVQGIGYANSSLSHFDAIAQWMYGSALPGLPTSGWIGRWLDANTDPNPFQAVQVGYAVPLHLIGTARRGVSVNDFAPEFGVTTDPTVQLTNSYIQSLNANPSSRGALATKIGSSINTAMGLNQQVAPLYGAPPPLPEDELSRRLALAARLFNANLGVRVVSTVQGDYDQHDDQPLVHAGNLATLDTALQTFYAALDPALVGRVTVMTFSEFGRTPFANGSRGTDHSRASCLMVMGSRVKGGLIGPHPNLANLNAWDPSPVTIDFRRVYATMITGWLKGTTSANVLGGSYPLLSLFNGPPV